MAKISAKPAASADYEDVKKDVWKVDVSVNIISLTLFLLSFVSRTWQLSFPDEVVFDEMHYGKFVSLYMQNVFFFDHAPPLGKMLLALAGYYSGFDGNFDFDSIGAAYPCSVPYTALRVIPALCGSALPPLVYYIMLEMGFPQFAATLAGVIVLLDNSLLTQSRFILLDTSLILLCLLTVFMSLKFMRHRYRSYSINWWLTLLSTGLCIGFTVSLKYSGLFTVSLVLFWLARDYVTKLVANHSYTCCQLWCELSVRVAALIIMPLLIYITVFYVHLTALYKAGPHDNIMTSAFQASLQGGLSSITAGQPAVIAYGSQITLRHTHSGAAGPGGGAGHRPPCWLHSHTDLYPIRYEDGRGSSHQQQVTCYTYKDVNNWWIIKHPHRKEMVVSHPPEPVRHGDIIQLVHGMSSRALNSHDVAAPMSPYSQEVSCYIDYNVSIPAMNLWKLEMVSGGGGQGGAEWHTIRSHVRLLHVNTSVSASPPPALTVSGQQLPDWGHNQLEVVTDRRPGRPGGQHLTVWNVEEHRYTKSEEAEERQRELGQAELIPTHPTHLSFLEKFSELQWKMLTTRPAGQGGSDTEHKYSSGPWEWPLLTRGIAYWIAEDSNRQVYMVCNAVGVYTCTLGTVVYACTLLVYAGRRRRRVYTDLTPEEWSRFTSTGYYLLTAYLINYLPYFLSDQMLFLHHYLPALIYQYMLLAALISHVRAVVLRSGSVWVSRIFHTTLCIWLALLLHMFLRLLPLSLGTSPLSAQEVRSLAVRDTWELITHEAQREPQCRDQWGTLIWC